MKRLVLTFALLIGLAAPAWAGFAEGFEAYGRGDYATALREYRLLAEQGDAAAQNNLGIMYHLGRGVPQDDAIAAKWWRKAADQGDAYAQVNLGISYQAGAGVPQDYAEAVKWYRKAASQKHASGQRFLGVMFEEGKGVPQDYAEAIKWYRKAAEQKDAAAQNRLGLMYRHGHGVPQDYVLAHMWFNLAAAQGAELAKRNRESVAQLMASSQLAEAQVLAREWKPVTYQRQWAWKKDINNDGAFTISDGSGWIGWLFFYPGDLVVAGILLLTDTIGDSQIVQFFEPTPALYGGWFSGIISVVLWIVIIGIWFRLV